MNFPDTRNQPRTLDLLKIFIILVFSLQIYSSNNFSQTNPTIPDNGVDLSFDPKLRNPVKISAIRQSDGKLLVTGYFDEINGEPISKSGIKKVVRLNEDGSIDSSFSFNYEAYPGFYFLPLKNGRFIAFTADLNGVAKTGILNADGTFGNVLNINLQGGYINKVLERDDGKFVIFGNFTISAPTLPRQPKRVLTRDIAVLNSDGTFDGSYRYFVGQSENDDNGSVTDAFFANDGTIILSGVFNSIGMVGTSPFQRKNLAKLNADGSINASFAPSINYVNAYTYTRTVPTLNRKFYVYGEFTQVNGEEKKYIARLNFDGTLDSSFNYVPVLTNAGPASASVQSNGNLIITNSVFSNNYGLAKLHTVRLLNSGEPDSSFAAPEISYLGYNHNALNIFTDSNDNIIFINNIGKIDGRTRLGMARLQSNGSLDENYVKNFTSAGNYFNEGNLVDSVAVQNDGKIVIAGNFSVFNGEWIDSNSPFYSAERGIRLNADGSLDKLFNLTNFYYRDNKFVRIDNLGRIVFFASGKFWRFNADGSTDTSFTSPYFAIVRIDNMQVLPDGKILFSCGSDSGSSNGCGQGGGLPVGRLNENGSFDDSFQLNSGRVFFPYTSPNEFDIQADGKIIFGGTRIKYDAVDKILPRLSPDGSLDNSFDLSPYPMLTWAIIKKIVAKNSKIYIAGYFFEGANQIQNVYRLNENGTIEKKFGVTAQNLLVQPDNKIIFIGKYNFKNLQLSVNVKRRRLTQQNNLYRMNQDGIADKSFSFTQNGGTAMQNTSQKRSEMALQPDGNLIVVGDFDDVNGVRRVGIVRLKMN